MDYTHVSHTGAYAWQQHEKEMARDANQKNYTTPQFSFPTAPGQPIPTANPIFFNQPDQGMNLQNAPTLPQYQELCPGDFQMGMEMQPPMQTPMAVNTGMFMENPLPVERFAQNPMAMQIDQTPPSVTSGEQLIPPFEETFTTSKPFVSKYSMDKTPVPARLMGIPAPEQSLFMQYMPPPMGMPQQMMPPNQVPPWQTGGFHPMGTPLHLHMQMQAIQGLQTPQVSQMQVPPMKIPGTPQMPQMHMPGTPQMQMPQMQMPETPQMQQMHMSSMQSPQIPMQSMQPPQMQPPWPTPGQSPQTLQGQPPPIFNINQQTPPSHQVRFQGLPDLNSPSNPLTPQSGNSSNGTPRTAPIQPGSNRPILRPPISNNRPPSQVPKAVVQISDEPWQRTFPPPRAREKLKNASDPPSTTKHESGRMKMKDHQEYYNNMVYLGKPIGQIKDRIPAGLKVLGTVPGFQGNPDDVHAIRGFLNTLTDWANQYVRTASNNFNRYDTQAENMSRKLKELEVERKYILDAVKQVHGGDENTFVPDLIRSAKDDIGKLQERVDLLMHHHRECSKGQKNLETFEGLSMEEKTAVGLQKEMTDRRMRELQSVSQTLKLRDKLLEDMKMELRQAKDLICVYQVQIQELINKDNFGHVSKLQVVQKLLDTEEATMKLDKKYKKLFEKAKELARENQGLKATMGRLKEVPDLPPGESEEAMRENLGQRYQLLFDSAKDIVAQNMKMKEQLRAEKTVLELQAEYDKLKEEKENLEATVGDIKSSYQRREVAEGISKRFAKAGKEWKAEKDALEHNQERSDRVLGIFKEERDKFEARYNDATREFVLAKEKWDTKHKAIKGSYEQAKAEYENAKKEHEELIAGKDEELKNVKEKYNKDTQRLRTQRDTASGHATRLNNELQQALREKKQFEEKTTQLMGVHKGALEQYEMLTKKYLARKIELEGLKRRLEKNGPAKIVRMKVGEQDGGVGQEDCAMTMAEVMHAISQPGLTAQLVAYLKQTGAIKE
ncbi:hypothetical protein TWF281_003956 [Arthrobotrys megalospora]